MKKRGILNAQLSYLLAALGHKDLFMIGDAGMPIPEGVEVVDLVLTAGVSEKQGKALERSLLESEFLPC